MFLPPWIARVSIFFFLTIFIFIHTQVPGKWCISFIPPPPSSLSQFFFPLLFPVYIIYFWVTQGEGIKGWNFGNARTGWLMNKAIFPESLQDVVLIEPTTQMILTEGYLVPVWIHSLCIHSEAVETPGRGKSSADPFRSRVLLPFSREPNPTF